MKFRTWLVVVAAVAVACTDAPLPTGDDGSLAQAGAAANPLANRYIVLLRDQPDGTGAAAASLAQAMGVRPTFVYGAAVSGFAAALTPGQVAALENRPDVLMVEPDGIVQATVTVSPVPSWGLDRIDMTNLPLDNSYTFQTSGQGVDFFGIDTGIRSTHTDFAGRMAPGFTAIFDGFGTEDCNGHGTHTASTAAGANFGVARSMRVFPVRVLDCFGFGSFSGVIAGVDWVTVNATPPAVANMSLSGGVSATVNAAVAASTAAGVSYAVAAGNDNGLNACLRSPASEPSALTVAATDINDQRAGFSNIGQCVDIFAPGVSITAAWATSNTATNTISGTSMATPHVAGVAGLFLESSPGATAAQVAAAIVGNATAGVVGNPGAQSPNLMLYMGFIAPPGNQPPTASFTWSCDANLDCTFDGSGSTDDNGIVSYTWTDGNGTQLGTGAVLTLSFTGATTFDLTLTVEDADGLTGTQTQTITVAPPNQPPVADFTVSCTATLLCTFDGTGSTDDQGIVLFEWLGPGGGVLATGPTMVRQFTRQTTLNFSLRVTDGGGLTNTLTKAVVIQPTVTNQPPVASFTWSCDANLDCTFDGTGSTDDNGIVSYTWTDGNGTQLGTGSVLTLSFTTGTTFDLTLTVEDAGGLTDSQTQTITVTPPANQPPVASFTWSCNTTLDCTFDGTGSTDDNGIVSYTWTDGNGTPLGTGSVLMLSFTGGTTFDLTLTVEDAGGLTDSQTQTITVTPPNQAPVADFTYNCVNLLCTFDASTSTDDQGIVLFEWLGPGGGVIATGPIMVRQFVRSVTLNFSIRVTDAAGLQDTQTQAVVIQ